MNQTHFDPKTAKYKDWYEYTADQTRGFTRDTLVRMIAELRQEDYQRRHEINRLLTGKADFPEVAR